MRAIGCGCEIHSADGLADGPLKPCRLHALAPLLLITLGSMLLDDELSKALADWTQRHAGPLGAPDLEGLARSVREAMGIPVAAP